MPFQRCDNARDPDSIFEPRPPPPPRGKVDVVIYDRPIVGQRLFDAIGNAQTGGRQKRPLVLLLSSGKLIVWHDVIDLRPAIDQRVELLFKGMISFLSLTIGVPSLQARPEASGRGREVHQNRDVECLFAFEWADDSAQSDPSCAATAWRSQTTSIMSNSRSPRSFSIPRPERFMREL